MDARDAPMMYAARSERGKLRLTGPQRAWFLHQILTRAFEDMSPGEARDAALITAHGRMVGYMETCMTDDAIWVHFEPELRATLPDAIRRYVFATQVEIDDVSDEYGLVLIVGDDWKLLAKEAAPDAVAQPTSQLGIAAGYVWVESERVDDVLGALSSAGAEQVGEAELEHLRIEHGMARWGREMNEKSLPPEMNLDDIAIDYDKGCYVGQEAMAKIKFRGKVNRKLRRLR
ncbi:MAG: YgfZ/GcvT domain-containing protein, partial [Vicinamibacterales bacterium]